MADEDRISSLPDRLLLQIISRIKMKIINERKEEEERLMSTKEVIKTTTTISKRWRYLWTRLPTLELVLRLEDFRIKDENTGCTSYQSNDHVVTNYVSCIDSTLAQCAATDVNKLTKFKLEIPDFYHDRLPVNSWIHYAITRDVQEIYLRITDGRRYQSCVCDDELFFNNSCLIRLEVSFCTFNPPSGAFLWDKLKFLCIDEGTLDEDLIGKILSGSPCLETLELNECDLDGRIAKSLFGNFGVLERLSCEMETYERISDDDELFFEHSWPPTMSMKLSRCVVNGVIRLDKLKFLCIDTGQLGEGDIDYILSESPVLETLQLNTCCGLKRIDVTSKSVKNLVLSGYGYRRPSVDYYIATLEINAPYILTLTIEGKMYLEEILLENVSSLVKAHLNFRFSNNFARLLIGDRYEIEEEFLQGLLSSLGHVNEIVLGSLSDYILDRSGLEAKVFQFHKGSDRRGTYPNRHRSFIINSEVMNS